MNYQIIALALAWVTTGVANFLYWAPGPHSKADYLFMLLGGILGPITFLIGMVSSIHSDIIAGKDANHK